MENGRALKLIGEVENLLKQSAKYRAIQINVEKKLKKTIQSYKDELGKN